MASDSVKNQFLISTTEVYGEPVAKIKAYHELVSRVSTAVSLQNALVYLLTPISL